jgi:hypothetical protein
MWRKVGKNIYIPIIAMKERDPSKITRGTLGTSHFAIVSPQIVKCVMIWIALYKEVFITERGMTLIMKTYLICAAPTGGSVTIQGPCKSNLGMNWRASEAVMANSRVIKVVRIIRILTLFL